MPISINGNETKKVNYNNNVVCSVNCTNTVIYCTGITIKRPPIKKVYFVGDAIDTTGMALYASYREENVRIIRSGFICSPAILNTEGEQTITVSYGGHNVSFNVTVRPVMLTSISVKTFPTNTTYYTGSTLDTTGLTLTAVYNNNTTAEITSGFTCSPTALNTAGTQNITISYTYNNVTETDSFAVTVIQEAVTSITIVSPPSVTEYCEGDTLNTSGLKLQATYNSGRVVNNISSGFTCYPTTIGSSSTQTITVTYGGQTATFNVTAPYVLYTFPNSSKKLSKSLNAGTFSCETRCSLGAGVTDGVYAFDNDANTAYLVYKESTAWCSIRFYFNIMVQQIKITNPYSARGIYAGNIKIGQYGNSSEVNSSMQALVTYATMSGRNGNFASNGAPATTHTNSSYKSKLVNVVTVTGTQWGTDGGLYANTANKGMAEIEIKFKAKRTDLQNAGLL